LGAWELGSLRAWELRSFGASELGNFGTWELGNLPHIFGTMPKNFTFLLIFFQFVPVFSFFYWIFYEKLLWELGLELL
jgi:hypothetical protein